MKHCLVVDDSSIVRRVARRILEALDFAVSEAEDGEHALAMCREHRPDVILVDWSMPVMDGVALVSALRQEEGEGARARIIFCASEFDVAHLARAKRAGIDGYLMKPFDRDHIASSLREVGAL